MDRGRLFLKSSNRPRKQRRSSTPKRCSQPKIFKNPLTAKTSPVLPVLTISSECWEKSNPPIYTPSSPGTSLNTLDIANHSEVASICPFSYKQLPLRDDGVSSILCVTLSSNPLQSATHVDKKFIQAESKLKQARDSFTQTVHPTKALFIKYTYDLLNQNSRCLNFGGFTGAAEIKDCFGICLPTNPEEIRERKYELEEHLPPRLSGPRSIRINQEFFRISLAETNMIKAHKILHPLKQRQYLPRREDTFIANRPSLLNICHEFSPETNDTTDMES